MLEKFSVTELINHNMLPDDQMKLLDRSRSELEEDLEFIYERKNADSISDLVHHLRKELQEIKSTLTPDSSVTHEDLIAILDDIYDSVSSFADGV